MKKYSVLICIIISLIFLLIATSLYPGGSIDDLDSSGFIWSKNFFSNLFNEKAINGDPNPSRIWALTGMAFHSIAYGLFFVHSSSKIPQKHAAYVLKFVGIANMLFTFLIATPLHDYMITISSTLSLLGLFYLTVFILKTKLQFLKAFSIGSLLLFYYTLYLYGAGDRGLLAVMQKIAFFCFTLLILIIEYFTKSADFQYKKTEKPEI